jgi:hypothetical protein
MAHLKSNEAIISMAGLNIAYSAMAVGGESAIVRFSAICLKEAKKSGGMALSGVKANIWHQRRGVLRR